MNFDEQQAVTHCTEHGAGWRLDCLGDMRMSSENKFSRRRFSISTRSKLRARVSRMCGSPVLCHWLRAGYWFEQAWEVNYILGQALRRHITSVNLKSSPIPPKWRAQFEDFQRHMGYRFLLRRLEYPAAVQAGQMMMVHMWWFNARVAPVYQEYRLAVEYARQTTVPSSAYPST